MPRIQFTDRSIRGITPPPSGQIEYFDLDRRLPGFGLRVSAGGRRSWIVLYRFRGRARRLTIGPYPLIGLADARASAKQALGAILSSRDPAGAKRAARRAPSFGDLVQEYIERHAKPKKRTWREDGQILRRCVPKDWFQMAAADVSRRDVRDLLDAMVQRTPIQANRLLALLRKLYNFGLSRDLVEGNPCQGIERPAPERQRERVLTPSDLRLLWSALEKEDVATAAFFKLYVLTAQRGGELRSMAWMDLDLDKGWWVVPAGRSKNGLAHRVPLSPPALDILRDLRTHVSTVSPWVFVTPSGAGFRETAHKATVRIRQRCRVDFVPHDLRRTAASYMTSIGVSRLVVAKILNHVERGVTAVYDRHSYDREKREALEMWAVALGELLSPPVSPRRPSSDGRRNEAATGIERSRPSGEV